MNRRFLVLAAALLLFAFSGAARHVHLVQHHLHGAEHAPTEEGDRHPTPDSEPDPQTCLLCLSLLVMKADLSADAEIEAIDSPSAESVDQPSEAPVTAPQRSANPTRGPPASALNV
jgi:hypothetical protein